MERFKFYISHTKTHMINTLKTHFVSIITGVLVLVLAGGLAVNAYSDPESADRARLAQLEKALETTKSDYQDLAERKMKNEQYCTLAQTQAQQMTKLNGLNNARRDEIRFLQSKLDPTQPQQ